MYNSGTVRVAEPDISTEFNYLTFLQSYYIFFEKSFKVL